MLSFLHNSYDRVDATYEEFEEDVKRIYSLNRLFKRYCKKNTTCPRSILNNIVILFNCFGNAVYVAFENEIREENKILLNTSLVILGKTGISDDIDQEFKIYLEKTLEV